jgi:hypothetical protein
VKAGWTAGVLGLTAGATLLLIACATEKGGADKNGAGADNVATAGKPEGAGAGALVRMDLGSTVGVLLDEIPEGPLRDAAAADALAMPTSFWVDRATRQTRLTSYHLVFRSQYYPTDGANNPHAKGPLPLPDAKVWTIALSGAPQRTKIDGHDFVAVTYSFGTHILSDADSTAVVEPALGTVGGTWDEAFSLPIDPDLLLERTGYACMDEFEYPPGSVFEENTWFFYDDHCQVESPEKPTCHITNQPQESCSDALTRHSGRIATNMHFTRVAYDIAIASSVRVGSLTPQTAAPNPHAADLAVVQDAMRDEKAIRIKFFGPGSCEQVEGVVGKLGWRRLLAFSAVVRNDGTAPIHIGNVTDPNNPWVKAGAFEYSACHKHYHFSHYGVFNYDGAPGAKRAFCLEDTNRFHNDETTPLTAAHQSCEFQGIGAGWGDEYELGIPGQWVDITGVDTAAPHDLTFRSNPDEFMCEGQLTTDANGDAQFGSNGKPLCTFFSGWDSNNVGSVPVSSPGGSFVTEACTHGQIGPNRNCGFAPKPTLQTVACTAGSSVTLSCSTTAAQPQVLRVCETSAQLGTGVACPLAESVGNVIVGSTPTPVTFACPAVRDVSMDAAGNPLPGPGIGGYSLYEAPLLPSGATGTITCN